MSDNEAKLKKSLHLAEGAGGISPFTDGEIILVTGDFAPPAPEACTQVVHFVLPAVWTGAQHPSPRRQIGKCLTGRALIKAGWGGEQREIKVGDIWRLKDTGGAGHGTSVLEDTGVCMAIVKLEQTRSGASG